LNSALTEPPHDLKRLTTTPDLVTYVRSLWERREFALAMSAGEVRAKHANTVLGGLWLILNPLLLIGVYWLIFGVLIGTNRGVDNFLGFLAVGIFIFHFSQRSIVGGANSIGNNLGLIRSLQFPRALLPVATVIQEALMLRSAAIVMVAIVLITGEGISWRWGIVPAIVTLQFFFNLGGALLVARVADRIRDIANVLPFLFRLAFYLSGVLFLVDRFVSDPRLKALFVINPFYSFVSLPREYMLSSIEQDNVGWMWVSVLSWTIVSLLLGLVVFRAGEKSYGRG
jgi:teichoic acid transport system permease protein